MTQQYDPKKVSVVFGSTLRGFADGTMVTVAYTSDQRSMHVGADGEGRHIKMADKSGTVTIRLADYSPSNGALQSIHTADTPIPLIITDKTSKGATFFTKSAMVQKVPDFERAAESTMNEWIIQFTSGTTVHAGAKD